MDTSATIWVTSITCSQHTCTAGKLHLTLLVHRYNNVTKEKKIQGCYVVFSFGTQRLLLSTPVYLYLHLLLSFPASGVILVISCDKVRSRVRTCQGTASGPAGMGYGFTPLPYCQGSAGVMRGSTNGRAEVGQERKICLYSSVMQKRLTELSLDSYR